MAVKGDVDTEVVVVAAAPVGAGRGDQSAAGGQAGGGGFAAAAAENAGLVGRGRDAEPKGGFCSICRLQPERRDRSAGVTMTKAGSKGGNLRDKLDGNELDLSLSDLNEVPVKELVSTVAGRRRPPGLPLALAWVVSFPTPRG